MYLCVYVCTSGGASVLCGRCRKPDRQYIDAQGIPVFDSCQVWCCCCDSLPPPPNSKLRASFFRDVLVLFFFSFSDDLHAWDTTV